METITEQDDEVVEITVKVRGKEIWRKYRREWIAQAEANEIGDEVKAIYDTLASDSIKF